MAEFEHIKKSIVLLFLLIMALLVFIIYSEGVLASHEYGVESWSNDIRITNYTTPNATMKEYLQVHELTGGTIDVRYVDFKERYYNIVGLFSEVQVDKIGDTIRNRNPAPEYFSNHALYARGNFPQWPGGVFDYFEVEDTYYMAYFNARHLWDSLSLCHYVVDTATIEEDVITVSDLGYATNGGTIPRTYFWTVLTGRLDGQARLHLIIDVMTSYPDGTNQTDLVYMKVSWNPFRVLSKTIWSYPRSEISLHYWRYLDLTIDDRPVICFQDSNGNNIISTVTTIDIWDTHIICEGNLNGFMVDEDGIAHLVWFDWPTYSMMYINVSLEEMKVGTPVIVTRIANASDAAYIEQTWMKIGKTRKDDLLFTFNVNPRTYALSPYGRIDFIVVPQGDFSQPIDPPNTLVNIFSATDCQLLVDDHDNLFLFWFDSRTGTPQLYMKYLARPGIGLEIDPLDWAATRTIRPNETKTIPLRLLNTGTVELDAALGIESNASWEWDLDIDVYRAHLEAYAQVPVTLRVRCPAGARDGESIDIWVNASAGRELSSSLHLIMFVKWRRELDVECRPTFHLVDPGQAATYRVTLQNLGELDEAVRVVMGGTGPPGWTVTPDDMTLAIRRWEVKPIDVTVTSPEDALADDAYMVRMDFQWADGTQAAARLHLRTVVRPSFFVVMDLNRTRVLLRPGEVAAFNVTVGNMGNMPGEAYVEVSTLTDPGEWLVVLSKETMVLEAYEFESLELLLGAPASAMGGEFMVVRVRAYCPRPFSEVTADVSGEVMHILSLAWDPPAIAWDLAPMASGARHLNITSAGNLYETVSFRVDGLETGWAWWLKRDGLEVATVRVGPGETVGVEVWLRVPADAAAGRHALRFYLEAGGATVGRVSLEARVAQVRELSVSVSPVRAVTYAGGHVEMSVVVRNLGNGPEVIELNASGDNVADVTFLLDGANTSTVWVPRGGARTLVVWARVMGSAPAGQGQLWVTAASTDDPKTYIRASAPFEVVLPSLRVTRVDVDPPRPESGAIVTVRVVLYNAGPVDVVNVTVTMPGSEDEVVASIAKEGEATATFVWVAEGHGKVRLEGEVRFGPGEHAVAWARVIEVSDEGAGGESWWALAVALAMAVAVTVLLATMRRSRKQAGIEPADASADGRDRAE